MQKFLKIAEQHVQWAALGLGGLYLLWMLWTYVYKSPLNVLLTPGHTVQPGEMEEAIAEGPVKKIETEIANTNPIDIAVPDVVQSWTDAVAEASASQKPLSVVIKYDINGPLPVSVDNGPQGKLAFKVLPTLPAAYPVAVASYRTEVQYPDPTFAAQPGNTGAAAPLVQKDIDAVSVEFKLDAQQLSNAFVQAYGQNAPPKLYQSSFLQVKLFREELGGDGQWSEPTVVSPLQIHEMLNYPGDTVQPQIGLVYKSWAEQHQQDIVAPAFYDTVPNFDTWVTPDKAPSAVASPAPVAPAPPAAAGVGAVRPGAGPIPGHIGIPVPGGAPGMRFPGGPLPPNQYNPPPDTGVDQGAAMAGAGVFNVLQAKDFTIIAHDDTVEPDKTYRYYVQYRLYNTIYDSGHLAPPALIQQLALISPDISKSQPTQQITIPSRSKLWVKGIGWNNRKPQARFAVFVWQPNVTETEVAVAPGDLIPPTQFSLVDIREDGKTQQYYVLLMDKDGKLSRRDYQQDIADPDQKKLHDLANPTPAAGGPVPPGASALNPAQPQ
jgi:hypothetical protein